MPPLDTSGTPAAPGGADLSLYADVLKALGIQVGAGGGWVNGIPTTLGSVPRPAGITVANTWGGRQASQGLPGWALTILNTASKLSPANQQKLYQHWVNKQGVAPQWQDIAGARPDWATEQMKSLLGGMGVTGT